MVLVTGCAGFIGSNFIHLWQRTKDEPLVHIDKLTYAANLENLSNLPHPERYEFIKGDIGDKELVSSILKKYQPRAVLNFAAESHVDRSINSPSDFIYTNIVGTFNLLECARQHYKSLSDETKNTFRFHHVSTDEVYGTLSESAPPFTETHPFQPNSPYSASKASSDHLVRAYHHTYKLPTLVTNCSNNYGPRQNEEKLIPLMIKNAINEIPLPVYGNGMNVRDWLYVDDHCEALMLVLEKGHIGETYNIGGNCEKTNIEVVKQICQILDKVRPRKNGLPYSALINFVTDRPGHDWRYAIDIGKIEKELRWHPKETFDTGIKKTINWYLAKDQR